MFYLARNEDFGVNSYLGNIQIFYRCSSGRLCMSRRQHAGKWCRSASLLGSQERGKSMTPNKCGKMTMKFEGSANHSKYTKRGISSTAIFLLFLPVKVTKSQSLCILLLKSCQHAYILHHNHSMSFSRLTVHCFFSLFFLSVFPFGQFLYQCYQVC